MLQEADQGAIDRLLAAIREAPMDGPGYIPPAIVRDAMRALDVLERPTLSDWLVVAWMGALTFAILSMMVRVWLS